MSGVTVKEFEISRAIPAVFGPALGPDGDAPRLREQIAQGWCEERSGMTASVQVFGRRDDERRLALRRPASKKRQGTKSREVWRRLGSERYGDLIFAPAMMVGAKLAPGDLDGCGGGTWKRAMGSLGGRVDRINGRSAR